MITYYYWGGTMIIKKTANKSNTTPNSMEQLYQIGFLIK